MKKCYYIILSIILAACNDDGKQTAQTGSAGSTGEPQGQAAQSSGRVECNNLVLFRKGAILEAATYDAAGKESAKQTTTVIDVKEEGGMTIATSSAETASSLGNKTINLVYKCDGKNLYMDLNSMMQDVAGMKDAKADIKSLSFPIQMTEGETLPESSFTMDMGKGGTNMKIKTSYKNRTVGPKEKITTPAGSWDCFKVSADIDSEIDGMDEQTKKIMETVRKQMKMQMVMWVAPDFGMVKMEMFIGGKRNSYTEITSVK